MPRTPMVNPNPHDIADRAKYEYVRITERCGAMHRRLKELADTGLLDEDAFWDLGVDLYGIWENVCEATMFAVMPADLDRRERDWATLTEDWNTYSDGRSVVTRVRIEPRPNTDPSWSCNQERNWLEYENVDDKGVIYYVACPDPNRFVDDAP